METSTLITIRGTAATLVTPEGKEVAVSVEDLFEKVLSEPAAPPRIKPRGVRLEDSRGPLSIWVYELEPSVRRLKWIARRSPFRYGSGTKYRMVRLALPYVVVFAVFERGRLTHANECFFRVEPLADERKDRLFYPALLNCSRFEPPDGRPLSWICTQHIDVDRYLRIPEEGGRMRRGLEDLCHCLLETGFNYSSEHHEHSSWFTESRRVDPRLKTVENWQKASEAEPLFVLDVPWIDTGFTVEGLVERIYGNRRLGRRPLRCAQDLARQIIRHRTLEETRS